jgi:hypothetical protein
MLSLWLLGGGVITAALAAVMGLMDVFGDEQIRKLNGAWLRGGKREVQMALADNETADPIGSNKVYGVGRTQIGSIERLMIDNLSGKVAYAVLSFGAFLGIGDDHYPLPWQALEYDQSLGDWNWNDRGRTREVNDYYGVPFV